MRIAAASARFNVAFIRIGLSGCDIGVSWMLPRLIGASRAFELLLTGRLIDAAEADRIGLVTRVVPDGAVVDAALETAELIVGNSPFGVRMTKEVMWSQLEIGSLQAGIDLENRTQVLSSFTGDLTEAMAAFLEKRPAALRRRIETATERGERMSLEGRVALVTGGGRGIGRAIALGLAEDGADVASTTAATRPRPRETVAEIEKLGRRARRVRGVGRRLRRVRGDGRRAVLADFGAIDILVNNAGVASRGQTVADTDPAEIDRLFGTHAFGAWACSKLVLPSMRDTAARRHRDDLERRDPAHGAPNSAPYNMAKAALEALASTLAKEERRNGIHVNVVAPGLVDTEMGRRLVKGAMGVEDIRTMDAGAAVRSRVHARGGRRRRAIRRLGTGVVRHRPAHRRRRRFVLSRFEQRSCGYIPRS